jgi:hypothetical protein
MRVFGVLRRPEPVFHLRDRQCQPIAGTVDLDAVALRAAFLVWQ